VKKEKITPIKKENEKTRKRENEIGKSLWILMKIRSDFHIWC